MGDEKGVQLLKRKPCNEKFSDGADMLTNIGFSRLPST